MHGIWIRVTHTGSISTPIMLADVNWQVGINGIPKAGPQYLHPGDTIELAYTSTVALSYESGNIRGFINQGVVTVAFRAERALFEAFHSWVGWANYGDLATQTVPLPVPAGVWTQLANDTLGSVTQTDHLPLGVPKFWDTGTNKIDLSQVPLGSDMSVRVNLDITPQINNSGFKVRLWFPSLGGWDLVLQQPRLDEGAGIPYRVTQSFDFYVGSAAVAAGGAEIQVWSEFASSVKIQSFYIELR